MRNVVVMSVGAATRSRLQLASCWPVTIELCMYGSRSYPPMKQSILLYFESGVILDLVITFLRTTGNEDADRLIAQGMLDERNAGPATADAVSGSSLMFLHVIIMSDERALDMQM